MNITWPELTFPYVNLYNAPLSPEMIALHHSMSIPTTGQVPNNQTTNVQESTSRTNPAITRMMRLRNNG
ncbi:MAG: hypothetical protein QM500_15000 [Methylococcales bacterium]